MDPFNITAGVAGINTLTLCYVRLLLEDINKSGGGYTAKSEIGVLSSKSKQYFKRTDMIETGGIT